MAKISLFKGPPLWFGAENHKIRISGAKPKGGKSEILAIFQIRKNTKNPEISEIAISPQSHIPTIPEFFPRRPSRESERRHELFIHFQSTYRLKKCACTAVLSL